MRSLLVVGNWKMNLRRDAAVQLASSLAGRGRSLPAGVEVGLCPPFPYLDAASKELAASPIRLGAQNLYPEPRGAFTGEVSGEMLADLGCLWVIVGHSERRHVLGEPDSLIRRKVRAALSAGLRPIVCVGELAQERDRNETKDVVAAQVISALAGLVESDAARLVFAYEPVWAIGTGRNATPEQAQEVHAHIRKALAERYNASFAGRAVLQYGGSVTAANAQSLLEQPDVDGALVGGASLKADDFWAIVEAAGHVAAAGRKL